MTKDEILAMEAGEDLDRLVAVEVMGLICEFKSPYLAWPEKEYWYDMGGRPVNFKHHSTDISATWLVLKKLREEFWCIDLRIADGCWIIMELLRTPPIKVEVNAGTPFEKLPEAICKAALLAKLEVRR